MWLATTGVGAIPEPVFGPRPRLTQPDALDRAVIERAGPLADTALDVPAREAQWIFYYACPDDSARLRPEADDRHGCPRCGTVYDDERTIAAHRHILHDRLNDQCLLLAQAYALTGDVRYAVPVRDALLALARLYPDWPRHDRWGRTGLLAVVGGRRYSQHLDEAVSVIRLARAYDLTAAAACYSEDDRATIEQDLLGYVVREILRYQRFVSNRTNHQTWFNAAYVNVGTAIGDAELVREGLQGRFGLFWQLDTSVTADGVWYEGTMSYHFYALEAIQLTLEAARAAGIDFSANARLRSLWEGPQRVAWPDGRLPAINDSDPANLAAYGRHFVWAGDYFGDAFNLTPAEGSAALDGAGLAILRLGTGRQAVAAILDYGEHGGSHGHYDKLQLLLYAGGREWLLDPGRLTYSVPEYETWAKTTAAHNTIAIDGRNQAATTGRLLWLRNGDGWTAAAAESDGAYPGVMLRRYLLLTPDFLADVFEIEGEHEMQVDWFAHAVSRTLEPDGDAADAPERLGEHDGYPHLKAVRRLSPEGPWTFVDGGSRLRVLAVPEAGETVYAAMGIGYRLDQQVPCLVRRRQTARTRFVALYDWSGGVESLRADASGALEVDADGVMWRITFEADGVTMEYGDVTSSPEHDVSRDMINDDT